MANKATQKQKEMTPEEARAVQINLARKTLESKFFQDVLGGNQVRSDPFSYGQKGINGAETAYADVSGSDEFNKARKALYQKAKQRGDNLGVYGEPSVTNYEVSADLIEQIEHSKQLLPLGDLATIVKGLAPEVETLPKELEAYVPQVLDLKIQMAKMAGRKTEDALTEQEVDAFNAYQALSQAYNTGVALKISRPGHFAEANKILKSISEKYNKTGSQ